MVVLNKDEIDNWLFEHAYMQGHKINLLEIKHGQNVTRFSDTYVDTVTNEKIGVVYRDVVQVGDDYTSLIRDCCNNVI